MTRATLDLEFPNDSPVAEVSLKGPGALKVIFELDGHIKEIQLDSTDGNSSLSIKSKLKKTPVYVHNITVGWPVKRH